MKAGDRPANPEASDCHTKGRPTNEKLFVLNLTNGEQGGRLGAEVAVHSLPARPEQTSSRSVDRR